MSDAGGRSTVPRVRVSGIARQNDGSSKPDDDDEPMVRRALVFAADSDDEITRVDRLKPFFLEVQEEGREDEEDEEEECARVELSPQVVLEPTTKKKDLKWEDLSSAHEILAELTADKSKEPSSLIPDDRFDVASVTIRDGDRVVILAEDAEYTFLEPTQHRAAPVRKLARLTARAIAVGDDADAVLDEVLETLDEPPAAKEKKKEAPSRSPHRTGRSRRGYVIGGIGAALILIAFISILSTKLAPIDVDIIAMGLSFIMTGAAALSFSRRPMFVKRDKAIDGGAGRTWLPSMILLYALPMALIVTFAVAEDVFSARHVKPPEPPVNVSLASCVGAALYALMLLATFQFRKELITDARLLEKLLRAPRLLPAPEVLNTVWGSIDGFVSDPTPVTADGEASAIAHVIDETSQPGSNPNILTERILSAGTFFVCDDNGRVTFEVFPKDAVWTSVVRLRTPQEGRTITHAQVIPIGGSVLIAGRGIREKKKKRGQLRSTGEESLLIFAADRRANAREEARALVRFRKNAMAIIVFAIVADVTLAALTAPQLPAFHATSSDD